MDPERQTAHVDDPSGRSSDPVHPRAPILDGQGRSRSWKSSSGDEGTVPCACGCGSLIAPHDRRGRLMRFVWGHHPKGIPIDRRTRRSELEATAPLCGCGCGQQVRLDRGFEGRRGRIPKWPGFLPGHNLAREGRGPIPDETLGLLYGTLLGDSGIPRPHATAHPRVQFTHGECQRKWAEYKADRLQGLGIGTQVKENAGFGKRSCVGCGICHPGLEAVLQVIGYPKRISAEWLRYISEEGWAWWYMDDGHLTRGGATFHTEGFPKGEVEIIAEFLQGMGFNPIIEPTRKYFILRFRVGDAIHWIERFKKFRAPGMEYKFPDGYGDHRRPASWGRRRL